MSQPPGCGSLSAAERARLERAIDHFLQNVGRFRACGVQDHLDVRRVVYESSFYDHDAVTSSVAELRTRLAAVLARDKHEVGRILAAFDACFVAAERVPSPAVMAASAGGQEAWTLAPPAFRLRAAVGRWAAGADARHWTSQWSRWRVRVILIAGFVASLLGALLFVWSREPGGGSAQGSVITAHLPVVNAEGAKRAPRRRDLRPTDERDGGATDAGASVPMPLHGSSMDAARPTRSARHGATAAGDGTPPWLLTRPRRVEVRSVARSWSGLHLERVAGAFVVIFLLVRALLSIGSDEERRRDAYEQRQLHARRTRQKLAEDAARGGLGSVADYPTCPDGPMSLEQIHHVAVLLTRAAPGGANRGEVDGGRTIERTVEEGGRLVLVPTRALRSTSWLVLTDVEVGDHPYLGGIERTLDALARHGVHLTRYHFRFQPDMVTRAGGGKRLPLKCVLDQHPNTAVVIISRELRPFRGLEGDLLAPWTGLIAHSARMAWLDPDPRPLSVRGRKSKQVSALKASGLPRLPFSAAGWAAAVKVVNSEGALPTDVPWPELPSGPRVVDALQAWALAAAVVPEATWDYLEEVRRERSLPEINEILNEWHHIQLLLDWFELCQRQSAVSGDGHHLAMTRQAARDIIELHRLRARMRPAPSLEHRLRQRLLGLLEQSEPTEAWARLNWSLHRASHRLALEPDAASEILDQFVGTAIEPIALEVLGEEVALQAHDLAASGAAASAVGLRHLQWLRGLGGFVTVSALWKADVTTTVRAALWAALLCSVGAALALGVITWRDTVVVETPAVYVVAHPRP